MASDYRRELIRFRKSSKPWRTQKAHSNGFMQVQHEAAQASGEAMRVVWERSKCARQSLRWAAPSSVFHDAILRSLPPFVPRNGRSGWNQFQLYARSGRTDTAGAFRHHGCAMDAAVATENYDSKPGEKQWSHKKAQKFFHLQPLP